MAKGQSLQDPYLNALRRERIPVSIYLVNGIKLQGQIESFDQFVILLKNTVNQMVYKHHNANQQQQHQQGQQQEVPSSVETNTDAQTE